MKKSFTTLCLLVATLFAFQANAELWLIGAISPDGWVTNKGVAFTQVDENNYTLDLDVTTTGQQYYSLTTQLSTIADDWSGIQQYRFGGTMEVPLDTETELQADTGDSPWTNFTQAGTYTFTFNVSTKILKVSFKNAIVVPTFNGTIYIDKASIGNIWAWDNDGNYFDNWPGKAINTLETATLNSTEYYTFTYSHNAANPGLIFNDGTNQTLDLVPEDGMVYFYTGGSNVTITDPNAPVTIPDLYLFGPAAQGWDPTKGDLMTYNETTETYSISIAPDAATTFSFTTKLAENADDWNAIATYRFGADTDGNDFVVTENYLDSALALIQTDQPGHAFAIPAGNYTLTVDLNNKILVISGTITPIEPEETKVFIIGNMPGNWDPAVGQEMTTEDHEIFTADFTAVDCGDGNSYFAFSKKLGNWDEIAIYRFGAVSEGNYWVTAENIHDTIPLVNNGQTLRIPAGNYTLTVNLKDMILLIGGEIVEPVDTPSVFMIGEVNENSWAANVGYELQFKDGLYKGTFTAKPLYESNYCYFAFTTMLSENSEQEDWDYIEPYRFGPQLKETDEYDYLMTEELLGQEIGLTFDDYHSIKMPQGTYDVTVDLNNLKLVFTKHEGKIGDANGDGTVDVNDVTTTINYILGKNPNPFNYDNANVNGDANVDVMDVTLIINIILGIQ